jgi:hypothetical protein
MLTNTSSYRGILTLTRSIHSTTWNSDNFSISKTRQENIEQELDKEMNKSDEKDLVRLNYCYRNKQLVILWLFSYLHFLLSSNQKVKFYNCHTFSVHFRLFITVEKISMLDHVNLIFWLNK